MSAPGRGSRRAGFTLIETLVALFVFALVAAVAQRGMVTTRLGLDRVQSTLAAEQAARSIVETQLDLLVRGPGEFTGQTDGLDWRIVATPLPLPVPPPPAPSATAGGTRPQPQQQQQTGGDPRQTGGAPAGGAQSSDEPDEQNWRVMRVVLTIANGRGRPLRVETLHNVKLVQ